MKRILGSLVLCTMLFLGGCSENKYELTTFDKNDIWSMKLEMYQKTEGSITLNMQESIFDEGQANNALKVMKNDLKSIEKFNKLINEKIEVYIIDKVFFDNSIYVGGNKIYCTYDSFENNEYREQLVKAAYSLTEPAIIHGLTGYIFEKNVDIESLKNYYSKSDDISILGLFGARFYEEWNSEDDLKIAKDTATSLVKYCAENNKKDLVISQNIDNDLRQQWLNSLGISGSYENEYDLDFNVFTFDKSNQYSLIVDSDKATYNMFSFEYLDDSKDVEKFIYRDIQGRKEIIEYLENNAPENFKNIQVETKPVYSYREDIGNARGTYYKNGSITLYDNTSINPHLHEYVHLLCNVNDNRWMAEGLAENLSISIYKDNYTLEDWAIDVGNSDSESYVGIAEDYYLNHGGDITYGKWDGRLLLDARAYAAKKYYSDKGKLEVNSLNLPIYEIYDLSSDSFEGYELSYYEAASFAAYLIDKYSLDTYLSYYIGDLKNGTFEEAFGMSYSKAKEEWISYIGMD